MNVLAVHMPDIFDKGLLSVGFGLLGIVLLVLGHKLFHAIDLGKKLTRIS
jgi:hypothetical protein